MPHSKGFLDLVSDAKKRINECTVDDIVAKREKGEPFQLVDVREESEYAAGHVKDTIHIGKGVIERDIERLIPNKNTEIILYCGGGFRSALAADNVQKMGYRNVYSMDGGWRAWNQKGLPTE